jgi:hypothetical protein
MPMKQLNALGGARAWVVNTKRAAWGPGSVPVPGHWVPKRTADSVDVSPVHGVTQIVEYELCGGSSAAASGR